ncbi:MAG TPA: group I intron-associated PD-(D/E)XK endonuclease [Jatrophihabitans sp.]|nr:group I intron-associated PD-(D/E)XK endonuclease [Jatrophihabitans sp.]
MPNGHKYTREELAAAVAASRSWRGVLRTLGRSATSAGVQRAVRRQVEAFGIDHSHFTGQRGWSDRQLRDAITEARSWPEVLERLGLRGSNYATVRAHAARLDLDASHLGKRAAPRVRSQVEPRLDNLRIAGSAFAAAWFLVRGYHVMWPLEPCRYDVGVLSEGQFQRVQVKTATYRNAGGAYVVSLSNSRRPGHRDVYDVGEIDSFFVIDAELTAYWIPFADVSGYGQISLRSYRAYLVGERGNWLQIPDG